MFDRKLYCTVILNYSKAVKYLIELLVTNTFFFLFYFFEKIQKDDMN